MKTKKIAALGIILAISLSACTGKKADVAGDVPDNTDTEVAVSGDNADEASGNAGDEGAADVSSDDASGDDASEKEDEVIVAPTPILYATEYEYDHYMEKDSWFSYANISGEYPYVISEGYDALNAALKEYNTKSWGDMRYVLDNTKEIVEESTEEDLENMKDMMPWYDEQSVSFVRCDDIIFSYWLSDGTWMGGAHPYTYTSGVNFDSATGKKLDLSDITTDYDKFYELVLKKLENTQDTDYFYDEWKDTVKSMFYEDDYALEWTITYDDINLFFNSYSLMPYAGGPVDLEISFEECGELVNPKYMVKPSDRLMKRLPWSDNVGEYGGYACSVDTDDDGKIDLSVSVVCDRHYDEEYEYYDCTNVTVSMEKDGEETWHYLEMMDYDDAWIVEDEKGDYYLYIEELSDNDWHVLNIFDLNGKGIKYLDYNESGAFYNMDFQCADHIFVTTRLYTMGTYSGVTECEVGRSGQLASKTGEYRVFTREVGVALDKDALKDSYSDSSTYESDPYLTATEDIPNMIYYTDINNREVSEKRTITKGTKLLPMYTDGEKYMIFKVKGEDAYYRVDYDNADERTINGVPEADCLEGFIYAG